jgi:hypothetical protein
MVALIEFVANVSIKFQKQMQCINYSTAQDAVKFATNKLSRAPTDSRSTSSIASKHNCNS